VGGTPESRIQRDYEPVQPTYAQSTTRIKKPSLNDMGPGTDRPVPAREGGEAPTSRVRKPHLDEMGSHLPIPAREGRDAPSSRVRKPTLDEMSSYASRPIPVDPRTKAGAFGEKIRGPHKPTLDEMGPHAERGLPIDGPRPQKPTRTIDIEDPAKKKHRHGRPRKTGRPGQ
jgi:excinuclease ABC subunit B